MNDFTYNPERQFKAPPEWRFKGPLEKARERYRERFQCEPGTPYARGAVLCFFLPAEQEQLSLFGGDPCLTLSNPETL